MINNTYDIKNQKVNVITVDTVIIGSGCAGFNAADTLFDLGRKDIALITEGINMGTSRNTGSDKQTYYKLTLASDCSDSIFELAQNLFNGGGVNGDTALVEAACSVRSFMKLVNLGVPFPTNKFGEYVGYKTDHDPRQRATSCGPLTSKLMTQQLEKSVVNKQIKIFDKMQAVKLITSSNKIVGIIALDLSRMSSCDMGITLFNVNNVIMATGGPAGVYYTSVYPASQTGMTGMAIEAGVKCCNLQEWQYGLASIKFRWNVSGTYQQVLPKYISINKNGEEREFLTDYFDDPKKALDMVFLKGYQWPFDVKKISGSSIIDIIVHHEIFDLGNRIFMDFRTEPTALQNGFEGLSSETYNYLSRSNALVKTPIKRLEIMNKKAIELYLSHGIDLYSEPLEVSVCAQHNNGGIAVDIDWQSNISGLFAAGEAAGTFGVYRPGGSALNSTQVGSLRAAQCIAYTKKETVPDEKAATLLLRLEIEAFISDIERLNKSKGCINVREKRIELQKQMSKNAAHLRNINELEAMLPKLRTFYENFYDSICISSYCEIPYALKTRDILLTQISIISAIIEAGKIMGSRGSSIVLDENGEKLPEKLSNLSYRKGDDRYNDKLITTLLKNHKIISQPEAVRELTLTEDWFENVWNEYNAKTNLQ